MVEQTGVPMQRGARIFEKTSLPCSMVLVLCFAKCAPSSRGRARRDLRESAPMQRDARFFAKNAFPCSVALKVLGVTFFRVRKVLAGPHGMLDSAFPIWPIRLHKKRSHATWHSFRFAPERSHAAWRSFCIFSSSLGWSNMATVRASETSIKPMLF